MTREPLKAQGGGRRHAAPALASDTAANNLDPPPPREWALVVQQLRALSSASRPAPPWWTAAPGFYGTIETRTDPASYHWDGMVRRNPPHFMFQFSLAGWGEFELYGQPPRRIPPGTGFLVVIPSRHRYYLPQDSPGWTFGWLGICHPYLLARVKKQVAATGPMIETHPDGALIASAVRLIRGAMMKDFHNRYELELALFKLVLTYEQWSNEANESSRERQRLLDEVRVRIIASLPRAVSVDAVAAEYGMSRSRFSHFFRARTGLTPARFGTEVRIREATRMLLESRAPLKQIADACGFANPNHFCRVFRRIQDASPGSYRHATRSRKG